MPRHFREVTAVLGSPGGGGRLTALRPPQAEVGLQTWSPGRVTEAAQNRFQPWIKSRGPRGSCCRQGPSPAQPSVSSWVKRGGEVDWPTVHSPWSWDTQSPVHTPRTLSHRASRRTVLLWFKTREMKRRSRRRRNHEALLKADVRTRPPHHPELPCHAWGGRLHTRQAPQLGLQVRPSDP